MTKQPTIITIERAVRPVPSRRPWLGETELVPGEDITTSDGQTWFHPYGGQRPVRVD